ncbi:YccF domain-containing protein [Streptomyces atratus]|uniref:YccF domain-containing protein n=1 Tax=Streptomyces atratus TaxID=1893 RepID=UPI0034102CAE
MKLFNLLLNIIWLVFCGIWMAIGYLIAALICFVLIITIPFGIASLRIAGFVLWPFGRTTVERPGAGVGSLIGNVVWVIFAGWWLALAHLVTSIPLFLSIIGIPFGWANLKLIPISLMPLGREVVRSDDGFAGR